LNQRRGGVQRSKLGGIPNSGRLELGAQSAVKTNRLVGPIANLKGPYFQQSLSVCLSVAKIILFHFRRGSVLR